jgi:hypothetical protein
MHRQRLVIIGASVVGAVASFLPWSSIVFIRSNSGIDGMGKITLALFLIILVLAVLGDKKESLAKIQVGIITFCGSAAAGIGIYNIFYPFQTSSGNLAILNKAISVEFGVYIVILVAATIVALGNILKD